MVSHLWAISLSELYNAPETNADAGRVLNALGIVAFLIEFSSLV